MVVVVLEYLTPALSQRYAFPSKGQTAEEKAASVRGRCMIVENDGVGLYISVCEGKRMTAAYRRVGEKKREHIMVLPIY